jgi:hypothetical protein
MRVGLDDLSYAHFSVFLFLSTRQSPDGSHISLLESGRLLHYLP